MLEGTLVPAVESSTYKSDAQTVFPAEQSRVGSVLLGGSVPRGRPGRFPGQLLDSLGGQKLGPSGSGGSTSTKHKRASRLRSDVIARVTRGFL